MDNKVLIGLDIGTNSVGWCVTDEDGKIIKKNGKHLWGVRMFDEASKANERRSYRSNRRRIHRRKERINLLRSIFAKEINKIDSSFFYRLDNSFYKNEDRLHQFNYTLFNDVSFKDSDYYKKYPTIYHLRNHLLKSNQKEDLRLIYLAIHHIIKYRGNFLYEGENFNIQDDNKANDLFSSLKDNLSTIINEDDEEISYSRSNLNKLIEINNNYSGISILKEKFNEVLNPHKDKYLKEVVIPLMVGAEVSLKKVGLENIDNLDVNKICARSETFDDTIDKLLANNTNQDNIIEILKCCKSIYEFFLLGKLLKDHKYISEAMVSIYEQHNRELKELKAYVKAKHKTKYDLIFRIMKKDGKVIPNYANYVGSTIINGIKETSSHVSQDEFYKFLLNELELNKFKITEDNKESYEAILVSKINNHEYLLRQNSGSNGVYPYQLNLMEIKVILENQAKFYPFLLEKDNFNLSNSEKIISILKYKIPYYVGPLMSVNENDNRSKFSWIKRTEEKIYPWNFEKIVDLEETAKNFIYRMLNKCSYLTGCYCLPKNSLYFSFYDVLSFLNKTKINGRDITYEEKIDLIDNLFKVKRRVTKKDLNIYFKTKYNDDDVQLTTSNNLQLREITCNLASYCDFVSIFGEEFVNKNYALIEELIRDIVVFEDKRILEQRLIKTYKITDKKIIKSIKGLTYTQYSRISKELLLDIRANEINIETGEICEGNNILELMLTTNKNLQEIIFDANYGIKDKINDFNKQHLSIENELSIENFVNDLGNVSPGMKRPLIQAYKICDEIEKILGKRIDEYYVECTRTNKNAKGKKGETITRQQNLLNIYDEAIKIANGEIKLQLKELRKKISELDTNKFQSDKYYLYFTQMGKCMYSGEPINIEDIFNSNLYDIDHIYPQSLLKDDSFNNRVLVKQSINRDQKKDIYPIPQNILFNGNYKSAYSFYKQLYDMKLIKEEKYRRLTAVEISESELESFLNRQLVYTNQAVKGFITAIETLKTTDDFKPKIVYSKSENVSDFRDKYGLLKSRTANNFHHAHDAYLNIIVGRTIDTYFSSYKNRFPSEYLKSMHKNGQTTNPLLIFHQNKNGTKKNITKNGHIVWDYNTSLKEIEHNIYHNFSILTTERTYNGNDLFGKISILKAGEGNIPVKESGPLKKVKNYGGFKQYAYGSYALIKSERDYILEAIPTRYRNEVAYYLNEILGYKNFEIIIESLKNNTLFISGKKRYVITGKSGNQYVVKNKSERIFSKNAIEIIRKIDKLNNKLKNVSGKETIEEINKLGFVCDENEIIISPAATKKNKVIKLSNGELTKMYDLLINTFNKEIYDYSASSTLINNLNQKKEVFLSLSIVGKTRLISNLLLYLSCNERKTIDLSLLELSKNAGTIYLAKKLKNTKIIYQSITGYYEKKVFEIE